MARAITKSSYKVLELLKNNQKGYMTPSELCYALNRKASSVSNLLSRLKDKGLIELNQAGTIHNYTLTDKGKEILIGYLNRVIAQSSQPNLNSEALYTRLHALALSIPLKNPLSEEERAQLVAPYAPRPLKLKNHIDYVFLFQDYTLKLTSRGLIAYAKQYVAELDEPIPQLAKQAIQDTIDIVYALETQLNAKNPYFKLKRRTKTIDNQKDYYGALVELHIAITNDLFAKEATKISDPYIIAMSEANSKKIGMLGDKSIKLGSGYDQQGIPEVEGVSHATLKDGKVEAVKNMENIRKLYEMVGKGEFDPRREQDLLRQMSSMLQQSIAVQNRLAQSQADLAQQTANLGAAALTTQNQLNYYSAQIEAHAKAIVKLNKVLDKLDKVLSQRKLGEYV
jgi:predicted transcriptional regulator